MWNSDEITIGKTHRLYNLSLMELIKKSDVPKTAKELSRVIQSELKLLFSPNGPKLDERVIQKMGSKSKKDRVDLLLIGELRDEEKLWTQYDEDEDCVLNNLNQIIFDQLIDDTIQAVKDVQNQRACLL